MLNWEWYKNANTMRLFIHLLLNANWKEGKFEGQIVPRGSLITGRKKLAEELNLSEQMIRTALNNLKSTKEITITSAKKFSIIMINNYELYQQNNQVTNQQLTNGNCEDYVNFLRNHEKSTNETTKDKALYNLGLLEYDNQVSNQQLTNKQPTDNQQVTTIVEYKNNRIIDDIDNNSTTTGTMRAHENIFEIVEREFGRTLSSSEYEVVSKWEDTDVTRYAIKQASLARATNVKYVERILNSYKRDNITSVTEAEERDRRYQEAKDKRQNNSRGKGESYIQRRLRELKEEENVKK